MLRMLILAVDTSTQAGSLAVLREARVLGVVSTWTEETYSSRMFRHLEFLLQELGLKLDQFDLFAVAAGPGSFTGLRVGLTAVKGWAEVYGKPIAAVSGLEAVAAQARAQEPLLVPVIDARRAQIYAGLYERGEHLRRRGDEVVMQPAEFLAYLEREARGAELAFVTPTPEVLAAPLEQSAFSRAPVESVSTVLAPVIGRLGYARALRGELVDALTLDANYIRRSDAELLWRG
jgi:tRNA threonylcarbamoyladenosine biosynthesis protein TsaB